MLGNMEIWWIEHFGKWETVYDTTVHIYQENTKTGARRYRRVSGGRQPVNKRWLDGGEQDEPSTAPRYPMPGPMIRRAGRS